MNEEASAEARTAARAVRDMYIALTNEGFSAAEALSIVGHAVEAGMRGNR